MIKDTADLRVSLTSVLKAFDQHRFTLICVCEDSCIIISLRVLTSCSISLSLSLSLCHFFCVCNAFASIYINILSVSSASLVYILDNVTSRLVGDIFSCFFLKVSRAANGQFTYAYQESLRKVCVSQRVCHRRPYVLQ